LNTPSLFSTGSYFSIANWWSFASVRIPALYKRYPFAVLGAFILIAMIFIALFAPFLWTVDPQAVTPLNRLKQPSSEFY
jgi:peptide/nickel transport system permease protein